jgi:hypothetical protein
VSMEAIKEREEPGKYDLCTGYMSFSGAEWLSHRESC